MKIVEITDNLGSMGGVASVVYELCDAFIDAGHQVTLIGILHVEEIAPEVQELRRKGVEVISIDAPSKKKAVIRFIPRLRKIIKERSADEKIICNLHLKLSVLMGVLSGIGIKNVCYIETYHNMYFRYHLQYWILQPIIRRYIAVSHTAESEMHTRFHTPRNKVIAVPNGVDRNKIRSSVKEHHPIKDYVSIVSVGRFTEQKNFHVPVEALSDICNEKIRYTVIGDGPYKDKIKSRANGNPYIIFAGAVAKNDVFSALSSADLVIMSSLWEGRSIAQLEAMTFNVPMIISDIPALRELFDESALNDDEPYRKCRFGYLVKTNLISAYQDAVKDFVLHEESHAQMQSYIEKISKENDLSIMADKYIAVFRDALNKQK